MFGIASLMRGRTWMNARPTFLFLTGGIVLALGGMTSPCALAAAGAGGKLTLFVEGPNGTIRYGERFKNDTEFQESQKATLNSSLFLAAFGVIKQSIEVVRDPSIAYNLEFANTSTEAQPFNATIQFPINQLGANTISAELVVDLIDANADGAVSLMGNAGGADAIQAVTVLGTNNGAPLGMDITTASTHSFVLNPTAGPTPAGTTLSLSTNFLLSAGDTAHITSRFIIDETTGIPFAEIPDLPNAAEGPFFNVIDVNSPETSLGDDLSIDAQTQLNLMAGGRLAEIFPPGIHSF
jgi:hypothetical protein